VPGGSGIVVAVLVVVAVGWFSYGPINRMLTVDEAKYIRRMEESLATIEKLSGQTDQNELYKVQDEMYREFNDYIKVMHGAGATTGSSKNVSPHSADSPRSFASIRNATRTSAKNC
jgi:hypothetical protein